MTLSRQKKNLWLAIGSMLFILLALGAGYLYRESVRSQLTQLIKDRLQERIPEGYVLNFDHLYMDFRQQQLLLEGFSMQPGGQTHLDRTYDIYVPELEIELASFWKAVWDKSLVVEMVRINDPHVNIESLREKNERSFSSESLSFLDLIGDYLFHFELQDLGINNASFLYHDHRKEELKAFAIGEIDLLIQNFSLDSNLHRHDFLNAEEIQIRVSDEKYDLGDGIHELSFSSCLLSTKDSLLLFDDVALRPKNGPIDGEKRIVDIQMPTLAFSGIDFVQSYLKRNLQLDQLLIDAPIIKYLDAPSLEKKVKKDNPIQVALSSLSTHLEIEEIILREADIDLNFQKSNAREIRFQVDSIVIYDFLLDENTVLFEEEMPFRNIEIALHSIQQDLPGALTSIDMETAFLSTIKQEIALQEVSIGKIGEEDYFFQNIPSIKLSGLDIFQVLLDNKVEVEELSLINPNTRLKRSIRERKEQDERKSFFEALAAFFSGFFIKEINTEHLQIIDGQFTIEDELFVESYSYKAQDLQLNQYVNQWSRILPNFIFDARNISLESDTLQLNLAHYQTDGIDHLVDTLLLQMALGDSLKLEIPQLELQNVILDSLFAGKLFADTLVVKYASLEGSLSNQERKAKEDSTTNPLPLFLENVFIDKSEVQLELPKEQSISWKLPQLNFSWEDTLNLHLIQIEDLQFHDPHKHQSVSIGKLSQIFDVNDYVLDSIQFIGNQAILEDSSISLQQLRIYDVDWDKVLNDKELKARKLVLNQPHALFKIEQQKQDSAEQKRDWPSFGIDTLLLFDGAFSFDIPERDLNMELPQLSAAVYDLKLPDSLSKNWYQSLIVETHEKVLVDHPDFSFQLDQFIYNSDLEVLQLDDLLYQAKVKHPLKSYQLHNLAIDGFDPLAFVQQKAIKWRSLRTGEGNLNLEFSAEPEATEEEKETEFPSIELAVDEFKFGKTKLDLWAKQAYLMQGIWLEGEGLHIDSSFSLSTIENHYDRLDFGIDSIHFLTGANEEYALDLSLDYYSESQDLQIHNFHLSKQLADTLFTEQLEFRSDYWDIFTKEIWVEECGLNALFNKPLKVEKLHLLGLEAKDYNNETIPLKPVYKPLLPEQLKSIKYPFAIDSLFIEGSLRYDAIAPLSGNHSWISLDALNLSMTNVCNLRERFGDGMKVNAQGLLYNHAPFDIDIFFDLKMDNAAFEMSGSVDNLKLTELNPMLVPQAAVQINRGSSRRILFNLAANDKVAVGDMLFRYRKLRIQFLDKENPDASSFGNSFLSFWANQLVSSNNPSWLRRRKGTIYFERDQQKAISHFWVHSLLSGVVSSAGVKNTKRKLRRSGIADAKAMEYEELFKEQLSRKTKNQKGN